MNSSLPSRAILANENPENTARRSLFKSMGYTDFELQDRPIVGIANAWSTACPGHRNLRELAEYVKYGIYSAGGTAVEFGITGSCDGLTDGDPDGAYVLPSRNAICDAIEIQARTSKLDALVLMGSCDKIIPGMLMAAARLDLPAILVNGGPMLGGAVFDGRKSDQTSADEAIGMCSVGTISEETVRKLEDVCCPTVGSCSFLGTANTMGCLAEAMGMSLPGCALVPAVYAQRRRVAFESGRAICRLVEQGISTRRLITPASLRNAAAVCQAICGSTNAVLHLSALAYEAQLSISVPQIFRETYASIPQLVRVNPAGKWDMEDFYQAGGIPRVMSHLLPLLDGEVLTCTGHTMAENLAGVSYFYPENPEVIHPLSAPFQTTGSLAILEGNLAPNTAITKPGAYPESLHLFQGPARVFHGEEEANQAILAGQIQDGDVVVIRYEGPKGGPGMREMYKAMKYLYGQGRIAAVVTDGRFSGTNNGCFVGHVSPEAAEGGPIALVQDGDVIRIDVRNGRLDLLLSEEELQERRKRWTPPDTVPRRGYLRLYQRLAASAAEGGMLVLE